MSVYKIILMPLLLLIVVLSLFTSIELFSQAVAETLVERWAVVIGISDYSLIDEDLAYPAEDAKELAGQLEPIFGKDHVLLLTDMDASKRDIQVAITDWLDPKEEAGGVVVIFFAGHGDQGGYLLACDSLKTSMPSVISPLELDGWLDHLESELVMVILESCGGQDAFSALRQNGRVVMSCNNTGKTCWASKRDGGLFSHYVTEALGSPEVVDANGDNVISAEEIFNYTRPRVVANAPVDQTQTPAIDDSHTGELGLFEAVEITFDSDPRIASVTIDGTYYSETELPISLKWAGGSFHTIQTPGVISRPEKDYPFSSWSDGTTSRALEIVAAESITYIASYRKQHPLRIISEYGEVQGQRLHTENATVSFSISPSIIDHGDGSRHVFAGWSGDSDATSPEANILIDSPKTVRANWQLQYYLTMGVEPSGITDAVASGWYDAGALVSPELVPGIIEVGPGVRFKFSGWQVDEVSMEEKAISVVMDSPRMAIADYETEYELVIKSKRGNPKGAGWYPAGSVVEVSNTSPRGFLIRDVFDGWTGAINETDPDITILINEPKEVTAEWRKDYSQLFVLLVGVVVISIAVAAILIIKYRRSPKHEVNQQVNDRRR